MCAGCMMGASTAVPATTGIRAWLASSEFSWLTPRRMRLVTGLLVAASLIGASVGLSGT